jgi:hypothetical protein
VNVPRWRRVLIAAVAAALAAALGGGPVGAAAGDAAGGGGGAPEPEVSGPITGGALGGPILTVPEDIVDRYDYVEEEFFLNDDATRYAPAGELAPDGRWEVEPAEDAPFTTRVLVRRPADLDDFNGTVVVEWLNVTAGIDADPDFGLLHPVLLGRGYAYVGVSAQEASISGNGGITLDIPGAPPAELLEPLTRRDPERYGELSHPGDDYSYDIVTQVGRSARSGDLLDDSEVDRVLLVGESQSAGRLGTYINAVHPVVEVYDGFLVHSRGEIPAPVAADAADEQPAGTKIRTDLDAPVLQFETETDLVMLNFLASRQRDTKRIATWEVAGTAHADDSIVEYGQRSAGTGFDLASICGAINTGPQAEVLRAAFVALDRWVANGTRPPRSPRIETSGDTIVRDELGIAVGGIRTPDVDAPVAILTGESDADSVICQLFGSNVPFTPEQLEELYPSHADYVDAVTESADTARDDGFLLRADRRAFIAAAEEADVPG